MPPIRPLRPRAGRHARPRRRLFAARSVLGATLLAAVLPGSAYLRVGHRRLGWVVLAAWSLLVAGLLGALGFVLVTRDLAALTSLALQPDALRAVRVGIGTVAVLWLLVLLDQFRRLRPSVLPAGHRVGALLLVTALAAGGVLPLAWTAQAVQAQRDLLRTVFRDEPENDTFSARERAQRADGRLNLLLIGGDSGDNRQGTRADSILVASVDRRSGKTVLVSLPRSLQRVPFPAASPMASRFPGGFDDLLNAVYTYGERNPEEFPGARNPGAEATTQAVSAITGLPIDYYVLVNLDGFRDVVDAIGGITLRVEERVPIGGRTGDQGEVLAYPDEWIEPGVRHLDGRDALWYARGRFGSDDYARMRRQRCVVGALLTQTDPQTVLRAYPRLAASARNVVETNVPQAALPELVDIALDARNTSVVSVTLTRSVIDTVNPDFDQIRRLVARQVRRSVARVEPPAAAATGGTPRSSATATATAPTPAATSSASPSPGPDDSDESGRASRDTTEKASGDVTEDLSSVCRYS